ncbi:hypothetical protein AOLI_G00300180 [Acnodon oligacanthus]
MNRQECRLEELCGMLQLLNRSDQPDIASSPTTPTIPPEQNSSTSTTPTTRPPVSIASRKGAAGNFIDADLVQRRKVPIEAINPPLNLRTMDDRPLGKGQLTENRSIDYEGVTGT